MEDMAEMTAVKIKQVERVKRYVVVAEASLRGTTQIYV